MHNHPFGNIDWEDRRAGRKEGFWSGLVAGLGLAVGFIAGLVYWGVL